MNVRFFVDACETLGRFASVLASAKEPKDRILIQVVGGTLKFIAGSDDQTVVVDCGPSDTPDFRALVNSRLFLSAGKALKGKGEVTVFRNGDGALLRVSTGGEVKLPAVGIRLPQYVRPVLLGTRGDTAPGMLPSAVRRVAAVAASTGWMEQVTFGVADLDVTVRAMDRHMYAEHPPGGLDGAEELAVPVAFMEALRGFDGPATVVLSEKHATVVSGPFTAVTTAMSAGPVPRWPDSAENSTVTADRKALIQMVKGTAPHDEHNRVVLTASGTSISVAPWGKDDAGMSLPAKVDGIGGRIGVTADYLLKLLNVIPTPRAGLAWEAGATGVIRVFGENDPWRQLLAPVAL